MTSPRREGRKTQNQTKNPKKLQHLILTQSHSWTGKELGFISLRMQAREHEWCGMVLCSIKGWNILGTSSGHGSVYWHVCRVYPLEGARRRYRERDEADRPISKQEKLPRGNRHFPCEGQIHCYPPAPFIYINAYMLIQSRELGNKLGRAPCRRPNLCRSLKCVSRKSSR